MRRPPPPVDLSRDPLERPQAQDLEPCPWAGVWSRLQDMELDRDHRALAWRILHATVLCGAFRMHLGRSPEQDAVCPFLCCDQVPQTLTHMFVTCPIARSAWLWVSDVWHRPTGHRPQLSASMLLADAVRVWRLRPAAAQRLLWARVLLTTLHVLWAVVCHLRMHGGQATARDVAARVTTACRRMMARHWLRVSMPMSDLTTTPEWLAGQNPAITIETCMAWWSCFFFGACWACQVAGPEAAPHVTMLWTLSCAGASKPSPGVGWQWRGPSAHSLFACFQAFCSCPIQAS